MGMLPPPPPRPQPFRPRRDLDVPLSTPLALVSSSSSWPSQDSLFSSLSFSSSTAPSTSTSSTSSTTFSNWRSSATAPQVQPQPSSSSPSSSSSGDRDVSSTWLLDQDSLHGGGFAYFPPPPCLRDTLRDPLLPASYSSPSSLSAHNLFHPQDSSYSSGFQCRCIPPSSQHIANADCISHQLLAEPVRNSPYVFPTSSWPDGGRPSMSSSTVPALPSLPASALSVVSTSSAVAAAAPTASQPPPATSSSSSSGISCPVCFDDQAEIKGDDRHLIATNCGHVFCNTCIKDAIKSQKKCPTCRKKLGAKSYHKLFL